LQPLLIIAAILVIYGPVLHGDWLLDDDIDITNNPITQSPTGLWSIWFEPGTQLDYYPLKASVQWLQWHLWGTDTFGYHLTNVLLHIASALLVWRLLAKLGLRCAWLGGLLFAVHPANVESVAWIAELKNTLSQPLLLLAMCAWIDFDHRGAKKNYFLALGFFLAAMLAKTAMAMFPLVLLLYAWWRRDKIGWNDLKIAAPFFLVSLSLGLMTIFCGNWYAQLHHQQLQDYGLGGPLSRLALAGLTFSFYLADFLWPFGLSPIYPRWPLDPPALLQFLPWPILGLAFGILWWKRKTWGRHVLLGLGFFGLMLFPVLGLTAISFMDFTWVMDHFLYLPMVGLIALAVAGFDWIHERATPEWRVSGTVVAAIILISLTLGSRTYAPIYQNQEALWTYTIKRNPEAWPAYDNLGYIYFGRGDLPAALGLFEKAVQLHPNYAQAHNNLGVTLQKMGRVPEAIEQFHQALRIKPDFAAAHNSLGMALRQSGRVQEAMEQYTLALQVDPDFAEAHYNLGFALHQSGRLPEAMEQYELALQIDPRFARAHNNLGYALLQSNRAQEAITQFEQALQVDPDYADAHFNLGNALLLTGRITEAIEQYEQTLRINPDYAAARTNLARAQAFFKAGPEKK
jgi:tetratricopeptide (TPR) repeat protein